MLVLTRYHFAARDVTRGCALFGKSLASLLRLFQRWRDRVTRKDGSGGMSVVLIGFIIKIISVLHLIRRHGTNIRALANMFEHSLRQMDQLW